MTIENLDSAFLSPLNTLPLQYPSVGEGAPGMLKCVTDLITPTASGMGSVGSTYRLCRIPAQAKIKRVVIDLGGVDTNASAAAVFDINVAFSDSAYDGTQVALQSGIPTTALTGAVTTIGTYSAPNKLFGTLAASNSGAKKYNQDVTFNGTLAGWYPGGRELPLWDFFGFVNSQGYAADPNGYMDLLLYLSTAAATAASAPIAGTVYFVT